jgi:HEPN domain-containing protein
MDNLRLDLVRSWARKSRHDLTAARKLAAGDDPCLDVAIYHCQQAAEKALKGLLALHGARIDKTHDLSALIAVAMPVNPQITTLYEAAERLTPYATLFRYPSDAPDPDANEFQRALAAAVEICGFVYPLLPQDSTK